MPAVLKIKTDKRTYEDKRRAAYQMITDPMVGQVLRGEMALEEYREAVEEIKAKYPKT